MSILIDKLLQTVINQGASDLHVSVGQPPVLRLHVHMTKIPTKVLEPDDTEWAMQAWIYARQGDRARAEAMAAQHPDRPGRLMLVYAGLGDTERAFAAFETFLEMNWWLATHQVQRPELALLWSDPRVTAIRRKLGLPPI